MRIGMKVSPLTVLKAGIPNYILNLIEALGTEDRENRYFLYTNRPLPMELRLPDRFRVVRVSFPSPGLQLWYQAGLPVRMRKDRLDLFHDPVYPLPLFLPVPGVITVHDLSGYTDPGVHSLRSSLAARLYPRHLRKAKRIIADSLYTASEIGRLFPDVAEKTDVVHLGVSERFRKVSDTDALSRVAVKYGLPSGFMLFLGTLEPRKNLSRLLSAFAAAAGDIPQSLVIAGGLGWKYGELLRAVSVHPFRDRIKLTGFVEDEDLPAVLSLAEFLVYPSLLEGFGLPVLEAMACGTPVMTSNTSSMPEVAGDAALLVDPFSLESMTSGLLAMATDGDLRRELAGRGTGRASLFTWERTARETLSVYTKAVD
ncbi:MAG: glycosyltransferase family 4 protein [Candidatus Fermentibacteraceae bacterium]|nr:glycosyltransferase family 4 protein [Candidatus Fermentibacteraceae bacterium]MBN2609232.1 glycosyltransferase family 4 protein [Candidatus Fermentibacteraceae bacterium]